MAKEYYEGLFDTYEYKILLGTELSYYSEVTWIRTELL